MISTQKCRRRAAWKGLLKLIRGRAITAINGYYSTIKPNLLGYPEGASVFCVEIVGPRINIGVRIYRDGRGLIVDACDPEALFNLLEEFLERPKRIIWLLLPLLQGLEKRSEYKGQIITTVAQHTQSGESFMGVFFQYSSTPSVSRAA